MPLSPIFFPIHKVRAVPSTDPHVAIRGYIHARSSLRATSRMTAASTPKGNQKKTVDSAAASTNKPPEDRNIPVRVRPNPPTLLVGSKLRAVFRADLKVRTTNSRLHPVLSSALCTVVVPTF